jgi:hypothetical protein
MSLWNNKAFTENELSPPAKVIVAIGMVVLLGAQAVCAVSNAVRGFVPRPGWVTLMLVGFVLFLAPKLHVVRRKQLFSFGTRLMTPAQANSYRLGYYFMALGFILTFG